MKTASAKQLLQDYTALQQRLCTALFHNHPVDDVNSLTDLPIHGTLSMGDDFWEFQRHGSGVCFVQPSTGEIVDAHVNPVAFPDGIDAWRLLQFLESKDIEQLQFGTMKFHTTNEHSLESLLEELRRNHLVTVLDQRRRIYSLRRDQPGLDN